MNSYIKVLQQGHFQRLFSHLVLLTIELNAFSIFIQTRCYRIIMYKLTL